MAKYLQNSADVEINETGDNLQFEVVKEYFESGSNTNGNWIKFIDGTMICWTIKTLTTAITTAWGVLYESGELNIGDFPVAFISKPDFVVGQCYGARAAFIEEIKDTSATSFGKTYLVRPTSSNSADYNVCFLAIGRWKA